MGKKIHHQLINQLGTMTVFLPPFSVSSLEEKAVSLHSLPVKGILRINETIICQDSPLNKDALRIQITFRVLIHSHGVQTSLFSCAKLPLRILNIQRFYLEFSPWFSH